jgi:hypothetical protein
MLLSKSGLLPQLSFSVFLLDYVDTTQQIVAKAREIMDEEERVIAEIKSINNNKKKK